MNLAAAMPPAEQPAVVPNPEYQLAELNTVRSFDGRDGFTEARFYSTPPGENRILSQAECPAGWKAVQGFRWRNLPATEGTPEVREIPAVGEPGDPDYFPGRPYQPAVPGQPARRKSDWMRTVDLWSVVTIPPDGEHALQHQAHVAMTEACAALAGEINAGLAQKTEAERNALMDGLGVPRAWYPGATVAGLLEAQVGGLMIVAADEQF